MMFLMEYNQKQGTLVSMRTFEDGERRVADDARLELELDLFRKGIDHEVVILDAESQEALMRTHERYFLSLREIAERTFELLKKY